MGRSMPRIGNQLGAPGVRSAIERVALCCQKPAAANQSADSNARTIPNSILTTRP